MQEDHIGYVCQEVLLALEFLHERGVIHRDVKAENILVNNSGQVKLGQSTLSSSCCLSFFHSSFLLLSAFFLSFFL